MSENFHPYGCDGPGKCRHCDGRIIVYTDDEGTSSYEHHPADCILCHAEPGLLIERLTAAHLDAADEINRLRTEARNALREIRNTLGPDSVVGPLDGAEGLIAEAAEALRVAKAAPARLDGDQAKP